MMQDSAKREAVWQTEIDALELKARGKVRDVYDLDDKLLIVATDRLSAFDCVLPDPIPDKGKVLNQISEFWFARFGKLVHNHTISTDVDDYPKELHPFRDQLEGRSTLAKKLKMFPVECVARGYISGSGWKEYKRDGTVCGIPLPKGLTESDRLPEPIFTPATKATDGHDENVAFATVEKMIGSEMATKLRDLTLEIYQAGAAYALERGIIIADTKFEFGLDGDTIVLGDEVLTPDSSRFWPADTYAAGRGQASLDKQYVRDWLEKSDWDKEPPAPKLPKEIIDGARARYLEIFERLTGSKLA